MTRTEIPKARRHARIVELLAPGEITSQTELRHLLAAEGLEVTQPTLSKDLLELRTVRVRRGDGTLVYAIPEESAFDFSGRDPRLGRICEEFLLGAEASGNLVVVRTPPGAAQVLASALDRTGLADILGSVAGDDTVIVVAREIDGGQAVAERLLALGQGTK